MKRLQKLLAIGAMTLSLAGCAKYYLVEDKIVEPENTYTIEGRENIKKEDLCTYYNNPLVSESICDWCSIKFDQGCISGLKTIIIGQKIFNVTYFDDEDYFVKISFLDKKLKEISSTNYCVNKDFYEKIKKDKLYTDFEDLNDNIYFWSSQDEEIKRELIREEYFK